MEEEDEVNRTLYCRGLSSEATEDILYELFLQAGPLEKVAIPQGKNMAFITFKHSVSVPYAKELFSDTKLFGNLLQTDFRTGSLHMERKKRQANGYTPYHSNGQQHQSPSPRNSDGYDNRRPTHSDSRNPYNSGAQSSGQTSNYLLQFMPPNLQIQSYRSTNNAEYIPQYISFQNPPEQFMGSSPILDRMNLERQRLLHYQLNAYQRNRNYNPDLH